MDITYTIATTLGRALWKFQGVQFTEKGFENFPKSGKALIAINHTGYLDFIFANNPAYKNKRKIRFMTQKGAFDNKFAGPFLRFMKHIPVDRDASNKNGEQNEAISLAVEKLYKGELVGIFPEGRLSRSFELDEFKTGAARIALESKSSIIPMVIWGSQKFWTSGFPKRLGRNKFKVVISVGKPIEAKGSPTELTKVLKNEMQILLDDIQSTYPKEPGAYWMPARLGGTAPTLEQATIKYIEDKEMKNKSKKNKKSY